MLTNCPSCSGAGGRGRAVREHGACLTFLAGAVGWTISFSRAWGSSQGERAGLHVQHLQRQVVHFTLAGWQAGARELGSEGVQESVMAHQDAWGCWEEKPGCRGTLPYTLRVLGSWEGTYSSSSKSPFNFAVGIFLKYFIAQAFFNYFFFIKTSRPEGNGVSAEKCTSNQPWRACPL